MTAGFAFRIAVLGLSLASLPRWGLAAPLKPWLLPDQKSLIMSAEPPLEARKLSTLKLEPEPGSAWVPLAFDATMPAHKHGMNVAPSAPEARGEAFFIQGVKLHMPGAWLLRLKLRHKQSGEERWIEQTFLVPFR